MVSAHGRRLDLTVLQPRIYLSNCFALNWTTTTRIYIIQDIVWHWECFFGEQKTVLVFVCVPAVGKLLAAVLHFTSDVS